MSSTISMIGHSSVLLELGGMRILTDPYFGGGNLVYARVNPPASSRESLRDVDLVLISHNHFDHADGDYLKLLPTSTPVVAPAKAAWVTKRKGAQNVVGAELWQPITFGRVKVTAVPAHHSTVTRGFIIESAGPPIYFAGDTYYGKFMERVASDYKPRVVLMPVATFRLPPTMGAKGALAATRTLKPDVIIPIHLGIKPRNPLLRTAETPERFAEQLRRESLPGKVVILREGQQWAVDVAK